MSNCVILVPVGGSIESSCEDSLRELERRGYEVRRVRGFAQIDMARNVIATSALASGFDETMWIDSDVGFHPDDVERLRSHRLPICCGIYPKKGTRELACHVLPGMPTMQFGNVGGLIELRYAATGFLHVRSEVYRAIHQQLELPTCNRRFGAPMIPFFQSLIIPDDLSPDDSGETWYLGEDYSFCERAKRVGFKIMADTTIRLKHFGSYPYQWEDAGGSMPRYESYALHLHDSTNGPQRPPVAAPLVANEPGWQKLSKKFPWPTEKPLVPPNPHHGWLFDSTRLALRQYTNANSRLVVEIGAWLGLSTRWLAACAPNAGIISIDTWKGSPEHLAAPELRAMLPTLFETWQVNCWELRPQLLPLRMNSAEGLEEIAVAGLQPELIFIDGDHSFDAVTSDLRTALERFPQANLVGDDWDWPDVRRAVESVCDPKGIVPRIEGTTWVIERKTQ